MDTISWKMSNSFIHKDSISRQVLSLNGTATFKHSHIKLRQHYKSAQMFTFNKSWTSNIWKHTGRESTRPCAHAQARRPTRPQTFNESFYQCHLIPQKVKVASVERAVVVFGQKSTCCPRFWKPGIKTTFPPPDGVQTSESCCMLVCLLVWWMNTYQKEQLFWSKQTHPSVGWKGEILTKSHIPSGI